MFGCNIVTNKDFFKLLSTTTKILTFVALINCNSIIPEKTEFQEKTDIELYNEGVKNVELGKHEKAANNFREVNIIHPYSGLAQQSEIMAAFSYYQNNNIKKAMNILTEFISLNPENSYIEYANYLLAMCYYIQISEEGRDTDLTELALNQFKLLITKFPNTKYARDAKLKIDLLLNNLAAKELNIGKYYLKNQSPSASIKRFRNIIINYPNSNLMPETLYRITEALIMLGLKKEAEKSVILLNYNFPTNKFTILANKLTKYDNKKIDGSYLGSLKDYIQNIFN